MLGLLALCLTAFMIYTLVRNALIGIQLNADDTFNGNIELIIPITIKSEFYLEPWLASLQGFNSLQGRLKIHILIDGHNPSMAAWQELHQKLPYVELHTFPLRPERVCAIPWMIEQVFSSIKADVVIIGDAELVPNEHAFHSLARLVTEKKKSFFVLPQTAQVHLLGESIAVLNPTLALASVFGFKNYRRNLAHPLMSIAQGWMGIPLSTFKNLNFKNINCPTWKQAIGLQWDRENIPYGLAFGEKHLKRYYPAEVSMQINQMKTYWEELWANGDRTGLLLFATVLFIWSFPVLSFFSFPVWSVASIGLLMIYRFFSKIVFQESWGTIFLHPLACLVWLGTFLWWAITGLRNKYSP